MSQVFISYSRRDLPFVERLVKDLQAAGLKVWYDLSGLEVGARWGKEIQSAIQNSQYAIVVLSPHSVESEWVEREFLLANNLKLKIIPLLYESCNLPLWVLNLHYIDMQGKNYESRFGELLKALGVKSKEAASAEKSKSRKAPRPLQKPTIRPVWILVLVVLIGLTAFAIWGLPPILANMQPTAAPTAEPTEMPTSEPTVTFTPVETITSVVVSFEGDFSAAYCRSGPETTYEVVGLLTSPGKWNATGRDASGTWLYIENGDTPCWARLDIFKVEGDISELPVREAAVPNATSTPSIGSTWTAPTDGMVLVYVPAGDFVMGSDQYGTGSSSPAHTVYLDAFWMDQTEVTNAMYTQCVAAGKCAPPTKKDSNTHPSYYVDAQFNDFPVIFVNWDMANAYCTWAGRRLPTEAEWEKAARGTDERIYPWGNSIDCTYTNYANCVGDAVAVASFESDKSLYGVYDMAGNLKEWVLDWYDENYYKKSPGTNPPGPDTGNFRVLRGGSFGSDGLMARAVYRFREKPSASSYSFGFRCATSALP